LVVSVASRDCRSNRRQLDISIGISGRHDFAVRAGITRQLMPPRPPHPALHVRDDRDTPLSSRRDGQRGTIDLPDKLSEIFLQTGLACRANQSMSWHERKRRILVRSSIYSPVVAMKVYRAIRSVRMKRLTTRRGKRDADELNMRSHLPAQAGHQISEQITRHRCCATGLFPCQNVP
jgi:hypothetical protein